MTNHSFQTLLRRILSDPWVTRFFARALGSPSKSLLDSFAADALEAARDADKLGLRDVVLADAAAALRRKKRKTRLANKIIGVVLDADNLPPLPRDELDFTLQTMYMIEGRSVSLNAYLRNRPDNQKRQLEDALLGEFGFSK